MQSGPRQVNSAGCADADRSARLAAEYATRRQQEIQRPMPAVVIRLYDGCGLTAFNELLFHAHQVHRLYSNTREIQISTLPAIRSGICSKFVGIFL
jgi:hypothetical protein